MVAGLLFILYLYYLLLDEADGEMSGLYIRHGGLVFYLEFSIIANSSVQQINSHRSQKLRYVIIV